MLRFKASELKNKRHIEHKLFCAQCASLWLIVRVAYLAFTITLPPPSGSSARLVPTRRQITPLLSRIVIA